MQTTRKANPVLSDLVTTAVLVAERPDLAEPTGRCQRWTLTVALPGGPVLSETFEMDGSYTPDPLEVVFVGVDGQAVVELLWLAR